MIAVGSKVFLKGCPHGQAGTVVKIERNRAVVLWHDLDYLARHSLVSLTEAQRERGENAVEPMELSQ
jgi:hypothetical protein